MLEDESRQVLWIWSLNSSGANKRRKQDILADEKSAEGAGVKFTEKNHLEILTSWNNIFERKVNKLWINYSLN